MKITEITEKQNDHLTFAELNIGEFFVDTCYPLDNVHFYVKINSFYKNNTLVMYRNGTADIVSIGSNHIAYRIKEISYRV